MSNRFLVKADGGTAREVVTSGDVGMQLGQVNLKDMNKNAKCYKTAIDLSSFKGEIINANLLDIRFAKIKVSEMLQNLPNVHCIRSIARS